MNSLIFDVHIWSCTFMTGLIWTIQLLHYPSFHHIDKKRFVLFESFHSRRISWIVLPVMCIELLTAIVLLIQYPESFVVFGANVAAIGMIWIVTLLVSARIHSQLMSGFDRLKVQRLIDTNWARTALWSVRSLFLCFFI